MNYQFIVHENPGIMAEDMAARIASILGDRIEISGHASIAMSGGSTPGPLMRALSDTILDWAKVTVTLTDERCVPQDHDRSNAKLVREEMLQNSAASASFIPLFGDGTMEETTEKLRANALPLDVAVFGLGTDLHTASLFPGGEGLADALDYACPMPIAEVTPTTGEEPRITLSAPAIISARKRYLMITGRKKREALEQTLASIDIMRAPSRLLFLATGGIEVHYAD